MPVNSTSLLRRLSRIWLCKVLLRQRVRQKKFEMLAGCLKELYKDEGPHIVICPASLLENWQRELQQWCPHLEVVAYYGPNRSEIRQNLEALRWCLHFIEVFGGYLLTRMLQPNAEVATMAHKWTRLPLDSLHSVLCLDFSLLFLNLCFYIIRSCVSQSNAVG